MVTAVDAATVDVDAENVAAVAPAAIVTLAGTLTAAMPLEIAITAPPAGAALESVAVPCELAPPVTLDGFTATLCKLAAGGGGVTVSAAVRVVPLYVPVRVAAVFADTADVVMVNAALVAPAIIVTVAGTAATALLLLESDTTAPPDGAAAVSVTVPIDDVPPTVDDGFTLSALSVAGPLVVTCGRAATASRKKSRDVELATLMTRRRKLALARLAALQVRPHVSVAPPSVNVARAVPSVPVAFAAVQVAPPSAESCTHIRGAPDVLSARARSRTSMPAIAEPAGVTNP